MSKLKEVEGNKQVFKSEKKATDTLCCGEEIRCFDCGCSIKMSEEEIENGSLLSYTDEGEDFFVFKCDDCFSKNKEIANYKECEIYTRIVGYLRPVKQYNPGKQQEYKERKEYKIEE